jgi:ribose 5-phosphate isomerase B
MVYCSYFCIKIKNMKIAIGADHAGFEHKQFILKYFQEKNYFTTDFGLYTPDAVDYPDIAHPLAVSIENGESDLGILICGTGNGVCFTANKHQKIVAALAWNIEVAQLVKRHNNANVLCLPARFTTKEEALACIIAFLEADFEGGRHASRLAKVSC